MADLGMRIGVYIDGYNLYYGGRAIFGRGAPGWRWLDLRAMFTSVIPDRTTWAGPFELHVVFCTARIKGRGNASGPHDQDVYLRALTQSRSADVIELGTYVERTTTSPLATPDRKGRPILTQADWPIMVRDGAGQDAPGATFMASIARREEKGSDVNVATHLVADVLSRTVDRAVVVSNDSDLRMPVELARTHVPLGVVNPTPRYPAGALNGSPTDGVGGHWWYQLVAEDFTTAQLPTQINKVKRPMGW